MTNVKVKNAMVKILKIREITNLATNASLNAKINEVKGKIPSITNLATTAAVTTDENKIFNISNLVKRTDYNKQTNKMEKKITDRGHDKYITTPEFNMLTAENVAAMFQQGNLASKSVISNCVNKADFDTNLLSFNKIINSNKKNMYVFKMN